MLSLVDRPVVVRLAPFAALLLARWYDREVVLPTQQHASATFDTLPGMLASAVGSILVAGLVLALGVLAWRSRSIAVGLGYALVGAVVVFDVYATFALTNGVPLLPSDLGMSVADWMWRLWDVLYGPLGAATSVAGGMLVAGVAVVVRVVWDRGAAPRQRALEARPVEP